MAAYWAHLRSGLAEVHSVVGLLRACTSGSQFRACCSFNSGVEAQDRMLLLPLKHENGQAPARTQVVLVELERLRQVVLGAEEKPAQACMCSRFCLVLCRCCASSLRCICMAPCDIPTMSKQGISMQPHQGKPAHTCAPALASDLHTTLQQAATAGYHLHMDAWAATCIVQYGQQACAGCTCARTH